MIYHEKITPIKYSDVQVNIHKLYDSESVKHQSVLDIFDHCLNEEEAAKWDFSFRDHNLRYEHKYISLFTELYELNSSNVILEFNLKEVEISELVNIVEGLDQREKMEFF